MRLLIIKYLLTALVVVVVSEIARRYEKYGALIGALPLVALLVLIWLHVEQAPLGKMADYARFTFWYVLPSLPGFLLFAVLLDRWGFWMALTASILACLVCFILLAILRRRFGIVLL